MVLPGGRAAAGVAWRILADSWPQDKRGSAGEPPPCAGVRRAAGKRV